MRLGAFALTTVVVATGEAVEVMPIAVFFGLYHSLPVSLGTISLPYLLFYPLRRKDYFPLLLILPISIAMFDFAHDLGLAVNLGVIG